MTPLAAGSSAARSSGVLNTPTSASPPLHDRARPRVLSGPMSWASISRMRGVDVVGGLRGDPADQRLDAGLVLGREADPGVQPQRTGELGRHQLADGAPGDPTQHLTDEEAVGDRVVPVGGARLPHRRRRGQLGDHAVPREHLVEGAGLGRVRQPGLVGQEPPHRDRALALRRELRPVRRHRGVEVELAPLDQQVRQRRRPALGGGEDELQGVGLVRATHRSTTRRPSWCTA